MTSVTMKRHEWWRHKYRNSRDLDHLSPEELSERVHDCMNNIRVRTERGKLGLLPVDEPIGQTWMILFTEVLEECKLRGYPYPGPISLAPYRSSFEHAFNPIPDMERVFDTSQLRGKPLLFKFGDPKWLSLAFEKGRFRVSSASYYDSDIHNHARRDAEGERLFRLNPRNPHYSQVASSNDTSFFLGANGSFKVVCPTDYYLFSLSAAYSSRLFGDFAATACLVIYDPNTFVRRVLSNIAKQLPGWRVEVVEVTYYDPVRVDPKSVVVPSFKPFRHAYQDEVRVIALPSTPRAELQALGIELGPLADCAQLVDLTTHPPPRLPHDPIEDPIRDFGNTMQEEEMEHRLPDMKRMQGILLNKAAPNHEDWYFQIQYTDANDAWHELKVPLMDGLYLLNLLRAAEKEQHLGLFNRGAT